VTGNVKKKAATITKDILMEINERVPFKTAYGLSAGGDANLDFAIYRTGRTRGIDCKAAVLMKSIVQSHPFIDGNKRTAFLAAKTLLELNGKTWDAIHEYTKDAFTLDVANNDPSINKMAKWFANHTKKIKSDPLK